MMKRFTTKNGRFFLDGEEFVFRSGAIHYFRVPEQYWRDRLLKLKECGFNCVETYAAWNLHEPEEGAFEFGGNLDLGAFLDMANELGLYTIVRPGPYICAEWESGGLPYWLLKYPNLKIRSHEPTYLKKATEYLCRIFDIVKPRLFENGGNILLAQVENEFGGYGKDDRYLSYLAALYKKYLPECTLFTSDGVWKSSLQNGSAEGAIVCGNFGSNVENNMATLKELYPDQPCFCAEFWCGWFDHWGGEHHVRSAEEVALCAESFLRKKYNFNFYLFHGGTNFGFMNGANLLTGESESDGEKYQPTVTSYDYGALLTEAGDRTAAYYKVRDLIEKYTGNVPPLTAKESEKRAYGKVEFCAFAPLEKQLDRIGKTYHSAQPLAMEECSQAYGYMYYETQLEEEGRLIFNVYRDRIIVFCNGKKAGAYLRNGKKAITPVFPAGGKVGVLLENMGRINFSQKMFDGKRIGIDPSSAKTKEWKNVSLPMREFSQLIFEEISPVLSENAGFYKAVFTVDKICDTFLRTDGFSKGFAVVNGFNLGRYWTASGPTKTLFVPATVLKEGENELIVFDSDGAISAEAEFTATPDLG